ncbi:hypothetical protein BG09_4160 [Bacillus thuringiensis serovar kurstaki str. HD-1]|nr:hypothetical protein BG09_4160 [Bacillus thuringiensis serovar kurstaki str. HD-1]
MFHLFILSKKELVVMPTSSFCIFYHFNQGDTYKNEDESSDD